MPDLDQSVSTNVTNSHLCNIINKDLQSSSSPDGAKTVLVRPICKEMCRDTT